MTLIKSISGIRGTIGGGAGEGLNPLDIVKFTSAYATLIRKTCTVKSNKIVVGRDARISGEMVKNVVVGTLMGMGWDVVDIDLASTPTTELAVTMEGASGGIILTASHNPKQWNALKLLNEKGEFLNAAEGQEVLRIAAAEEFDYAEVDQLGSYRQDLSYNQKHIDSVLALDLVDVEAIKKADFRVAIDCVNSVGGIILPELLERLGVKHVEKLYCEPTGNFQHNPEPLEKNLGDIMGLMAKGGCDVAFVVDPDVDRLAMICEDGKMYGEEYTLVTVADYVLKHTPGNTVSNLSSTRALRDVTRKYGCEYNASAVGEVNVVTKMKATNAVIGVKPADEYQFRILVTPVGPYFKGGAKPITIRVSDFDRAAPHGTGHIKAGLNYAMSLHAIVDAHAQGYAENMYLDPATRTYVEETGGANFIFITKDGTFVTPKSDSILPSITRRSLMVVAEKYLNMPVEHRQVKFSEVPDFAECGLCGTAAVISPIGKVVDHGKEICFPSGMEEMGPYTKKLRETLTGIQMGHIEAPEGWIKRIL